MQSLWNEQEATQYTTLLGQRVYTSRLLGRDQSLVMHGGGNTSVKIRQPNIFGEMEDVLYVKGSGWDLETIQEAGFSPCRMNPLLRLAQLETITDLQMANELRQSMTVASAPSPSVEAILHAVMPYTFVDHTHADAILAITNTPNGREHIETLFGDRVIIIPYVMPGFRLARLVAEMFPQQRTDKTIGMVLLNHGLFTFGDDARTSYERMIALVDEAEQFLKQKGAWDVPTPDITLEPKILRHDLAAFRQQVSNVAGKPMLVRTWHNSDTLDFVRRDDLPTLAQGPLTPDHSIRTKRLPMIGRDLAAYSAEYQQYFEQNAAQVSQTPRILDTAPRVVLDAEWGLLAIGQTATETHIVSDIYQHTMHVIQQAQALGGYRALSALDIFEVEYWDLEQAKLASGGKAPQFTGEVALVTGAASGIGKACVESLLARGAAVIALDINPAIETMWSRGVRGITVDVTDEAAVETALETSIREFGGLDMLVLNAGIFPPGVKIADMSTEYWQKVMRVNLDSSFALMRLAHPLLKMAPNSGRVVIVGSKNVPAPGSGAGAYSASKAALTQLGRVAAFEWGSDGIRVNIVHPNAVFDTGLWTEEVLANRAAHYKMTVEEYKTNNVLHVEVTSRDVAEMVAELCSAAFARTTGAQIPVDGGNDRVI
jgi:rhamnose utilization protein RhaD (predicted bifunctional aldolase and dehydrogenase)/NAD(P)-dependent dehydrogenase (short-subunit alcohol dehydrogenase family)